ncbi:MAG: hypothetical protein JSS27_19140 [Planctomycetes bacterium]|nr:hypothetical protein [Planctomycetota bacterium]
MLALGAQLLLISTAAAQVPPFALSNEQGEPGVLDASMFRQPDYSTYGGPEGMPTGYFGSVEALVWSTSNPKVQEVGIEGGQRYVYVGNSTPLNYVSTGATTGQVLPGTYVSAPGASGQYTGPQATGGANGYALQTNSNDTSWIKAGMYGGYRFDWGYMGENGHGWLFSAFQMSDNTQTAQFQNVSMVFGDPGTTVYNAYSGSSITGLNTAGTTPTYTEFAPQAITNFPLLNGFVSYVRATTTGGTTTISTNGFPADLNGNNLYGNAGRDLGTTPSGTTYNPPLNGIPDPEGGAPTQTISPGMPYNGITQPVDYGDAVPLPLLFSNVQYTSKTSTWGIEANRVLRASEYDRVGGIWEVFGGVRYLSFTDTFLVNATGGILDASYWNTVAYNRLVGPQIGLRWSKRRDRLAFSAEGRAVAAANFLTARQDGMIGSNLTQTQPSPTLAYTQVTNPVTGAVTTYVTQQPNNPGGNTPAYRLNQPLNLDPTTFNSQVNWVNFSPMAEIRAKVSYQVFRSVSVNAGWTGIWIDQVGRASNMMNWTLPNFGILGDRNHGHVFLNGLTVGLEINR